MPTCRRAPTSPSSSPRNSPDCLTSRNFPSIFAVDPSGLFLLHATQGAGDRTGGPIMYGYSISANKLVNSYFICHARSATAYRLPDPDGTRIMDAGNLGELSRSEPKQVSEHINTFIKSDILGYLLMMLLGRQGN